MRNTSPQATTAVGPEMPFTLAKRCTYFRDQGERDHQPQPGIIHPAYHPRRDKAGDAAERTAADALTIAGMRSRGLPVPDQPALTLRQAQHDLKQHDAGAVVKQAFP